MVLVSHFKDLRQSYGQSSVRRASLFVDRSCLPMQLKMSYIFCKKYEVLGLLYSESLTRCFEQLSPGVKLSGNCKVQCKLVSKCLDPVVKKLVKRSTR